MQGTKESGQFIVIEIIIFFYIIGDNACSTHGFNEAIWPDPIPW